MSTSSKNTKNTNKRSRTETTIETETTQDLGGTFSLPTFYLDKFRPRGTMRAYENSPNMPHNSSYYSAQFSLDVSGHTYDLMKLMLHIISVFLQIDPSFVFVLMIDNSIVPNSELLPSALKTLTQLEQYATEIQHTRYFQNQYVRFTMFIKSSELYFGGWVFNWLRSEKTLIRLSPNICNKSEPVCFFAWVTLATISFQHFYEILRTIFGRDVQMHLYERTVALKKKNHNVKITKGIALDVPDFERDFATSKLFATIAGGKFIFTRYFQNIVPRPLNLITKNTTHVSIFNEHFDWMERKGHAVVDITFDASPPTATDLKLISHLMETKIDGKPLCLTAQHLDTRFLLTCWLGEVSLVHEEIEEFEQSHEVHYSLATPPAAQTLRNHCASQSIISDISSDSSATKVASYASKAKESSKKLPKKLKIPNTSATPATSLTVDTVKKIVQKEIQPFKADVNNRLSNTERLIAQFREKSKKLEIYHKQLTVHQEAVKENEEDHRTRLITRFKEMDNAITNVDTKIDTLDTSTNKKFKKVHQDIGTLAKAQKTLSSNQQAFYAHLTKALPSLPSIDLEEVELDPLITQSVSTDSSSDDTGNTSMDVDKSQKVSALEVEQLKND